MDDVLLGDADADADAQGLTLSSWLADAAAHRLRLEALHRQVAEWEAEHGAISVDELDAVEVKVAKAHRRADERRERAKCQRASKGRFLSGATFDTGMLVALERDDREAWVALRRLVNRREVPTVPAVVTVQAWRDGRRQAQLARALGHCRPEPLSDESARKAGELCRRSQTADSVDAAVIESAGRRNDDVYTGDIGDLEHLAEHITNQVAIIPIGR